MGNVIAFRPRPKTIVCSSGIDLNDLLILLCLLELAPVEYALLLDLTKRSIRHQYPRKISQRLEARDLVDRPARGVLRLTPAGWGILAACENLGIGKGKYHPTPITGFPVKLRDAALYPAG